MQQKPEIYRQNKQKYVWLLLLCIVFVAVGVWMSRAPDENPYLRGPSDFGHKPIGVACAIIMGALGIMSALQLLPNSSWLQAGPEGLAIRTKWRTTNFHRWTDFEKFGVAEFTMISSRGIGLSVTKIDIVKGHVAGGRQFRRVGFTFSSAYTGGGLAWKFRDYNQTHYGFDGLLPDDYGMDCEKFAAHLNQLREQYVASQSTRMA
jgi:hypothetical protein